MISTAQIPLNYLVPASKALLLISTSYSVIRALRGQGRLDSAFTGLVIGIVGITYYDQVVKSLFELSAGLENEIKKLGNPQAVNEIVWNSIKAAADEPGSSGERYSINIPAVVEQLFRIGVWGIATTIVDFFFLLAQTFVEAKRDVLLVLVEFLFPLIWGIFPANPSISKSIIAYLIEMSLWGPCLYLIQVVLGFVAPQYVNRPNSLGVPIVAIEIVATLLILEVPGFVHRLLSGSLHPGGENSFLGLIFIGGKAVKGAAAAAKVANAAQNGV